MRHHLSRSLYFYLYETKGRREGNIPIGKETNRVSTRARETGKVETGRHREKETCINIEGSKGRETESDGG